MASSLAVGRKRLAAVRLIAGVGPDLFDVPNAMWSARALGSTRFRLVGWARDIKRYVVQADDDKLFYPFTAAALRPHLPSSLRSKLA